MTFATRTLVTAAALAFTSAAHAQAWERDVQWSASTVQQAEQALAQMNYWTGRIDARLDANTRYGLRQFQRSHGLEPTGNLNRETLAALGIEAGERARIDERSASAGGTSAAPDRYAPEDIRAAEQALKQRNYIVGPVNGVIEADTRYGLRQFQRSHDLEPTGTLNAETLQALGVQAGPRAAR